MGKKLWFNRRTPLAILTVVICFLTIFFLNPVYGSSKIAYYAYNAEPILDWDPSVEFSNGIIVLNNIYETLLRFDENNNIVPLLATEFSKSKDGLTWHFKIRKGVKFHDGADLDAEAVKFSIERTRKMGKGAAYIWDSVKSINIIDKYAIDFKLNYPAPIDIIASCGYAAFIVSPKSVKSNDKDWLSKGHEAGTGPYKLKNFKMGDEVVLTAFKKYWKGWKDNQFDIVVIKKISETTSRRQLVEKGNADITKSLTSDDIEKLKQDNRVKVITSFSYQNLLLLLNTAKKPLNNKLVRQALSYAFPYNEVVKYATGGYAAQSRGTIPKGMWGHGENLKQYKYDIEKAKTLLSQAGYPEGGLKLKYTYGSGDEAERKTAELYKAALAKLNVDLDIRGMPWESQWELAKSTNIDNRQDIFVMYWWPDIISPYSWMYSLYRTEKDVLFNLAYYSSPSFDKLIDQANIESSTDLPKAAELFIQAQDKLIEDAPAIFAYDQQAVWVTSKSFKGFKNNPSYPGVVFFYDTYRK